MVHNHSSIRGLLVITGFCVVMTNLYSLTTSNVTKFPTKEFLPIKDSRLVTYMERFMLCSENTGRRCCICTPECMKKRECCIDIYWNSQNFTHLSTYLDLFLEIAAQQREECLPAFPLASVGNSSDDSQYYSMITSCRDKSYQKDVDKCTSMPTRLQDSIPVYDRNYNLYKNQYCAGCNNVSSFQFVPLKRYCREKIPWKDCKYLINSDILKEKECYFHETTRNCKKGHEYYHLCRSFWAEIGNYKNYFCYLCAGNDNHEDFALDLFSAVEVEFCGRRTPVKRPFPWSTLLKISSQKKGKKTMVCESKNSFRDLVEGKCNLDSCSAGYRYNGSDCLRIPDLKPISIIHGQEDTYDTCFLQTSPFYLYLFNFSDSHQLIEIFEQKSKEFNHFETLFNDSHLIMTKINLTIKDVKVFIKRELGFINRYIGEKGKIYLSPIYHPLPHLATDVSKIFKMKLICSNPKKVQNISFLQGCGVKHDGKNIKREQVSLWIEIKEKMTTISRDVFICDHLQLPLNCSSLRILNSKTSILENSSLIHMENNYQEIFNTNQYIHLENRKYAVCDSVNIFQQQAWLTIIVTIEGYISIIGSLTSLTCYVFIIVIFLRTAELQNVPGYFMMALSISLSFCDGLFLCANAISMIGIQMNIYLCESIGLLIHFFLLSAQFLGTCLAIDVLNNLTSIQASVIKRRVLKFFSACFLLSTLIITLGMVMRKYDLVDLSYVKDGMCILHGYYARIIFVYTPLLVTNTASMSLLAVTLCRLSAALRESRNVRDSSNVNNTNLFRVASRLILVCGTSEIFGLLQIHHTDMSEERKVFNMVFGFLYSILKSWRGLPLFFIFSTRKAAIMSSRKLHQRLEDSKEF